MRLVLVVLLLIGLFGVTVPQHNAIPIPPSENFRGKVVAKWDRWIRFLGEIGNSLQEVGTTVEDNLLQAGEEFKAKEAERQALESLEKKEQEKEQTPTVKWSGQFLRLLRAINSYTMNTLRFYFAVVLIVLSLLGMYLWSYLFVTYVFDSGGWVMPQRLSFPSLSPFFDTFPLVSISHSTLIHLIPLVIVVFIS